MILIIHAHPYPQRSRVGRALLEAIRDLPNVKIRSLYDRYPDFDIDVIAEQTALTQADLVVWLHPFYWFSVPAMLKHWFDVVLLRHWAYGQGGTALHGKHCLWVTSVGGKESSYHEGGSHQLPFTEFEAPIRQTAKFCGMIWEQPIAIFGAHGIAEEELAATAQTFRQRLISWQAPAQKAEEPVPA